MPLPGLTGIPSGGRLHLRGFAQGAEIVVGTTTYLVDFHGNVEMVLDTKQLSQFQSGALSFVPLFIQELIFDGIGNIIGPVVIHKDPHRDPLLSTLASLTAGQPFPAIQEMIINGHVTIPHLLPGITLRNKAIPHRESIVLRNARMMNFPPKNSTYSLVDPIELEAENNPGPVLSTLQSFPLTVNF